MNTSIHPITITYDSRSQYSLTKEQLKNIDYLVNKAYKMCQDPLITKFMKKYNNSRLNIMSFLIFLIFHNRFDTRGVAPPQPIYNIWSKIFKEPEYKNFVIHHFGLESFKSKSIQPINDNVKIDYFFQRYKELTGHIFIYKTR
jgi:hypothetical protein